MADRELVEGGAEETILAGAEKEGGAAMLVVGDAFGATTHADLALRARGRGLAVVVVHNASVMNAVASCGLSLYRFGHTVSIPFFTETWRPYSFLDRVAANRRQGLHTLCLLDIKVKEQSVENMARGRMVFEPPRFMTVNQAAEQLIESAGQASPEDAAAVDAANAVCVGIARLGAADELMVVGTLAELAAEDFGLPLHSLIICSQELHEIEKESLDVYRK